MARRLDEITKRFGCQWLMPAEGKEFRHHSFSWVTNHTVLRFVQAPVTRPTRDD
jgi:hypothetical protein